MQGSRKSLSITKLPAHGKNRSSVRIAVKEDIPNIVALAERMHDEGAYRSVSFIPEMYARYLEIMLADDSVICFLAEHDGAVTGGIIGHVCPHPFSPELKAVDMGFYVAPEFRGTSAAIRLLKLYEQWASGLGVAKDRIYLASSNGHPKTHAFFEKMGYSNTGGLYQKTKEV